jgi:hypothetical protein
MQLNHLKNLRVAILSWLHRSSKACTMKNEGFNLNNGSYLNSHNSVEYFEGHGIHYAIQFQSGGDWSKNFNKEFWLTAASKQYNLAGYSSDVIPRILIKDLLEEVKNYLPLPEWAEKNMVIVHYKNTFNGYDSEGKPIFLSDSEWSAKHELGDSFRLTLLKELKMQGSLNGIETELSDDDIINSDIFCEEFMKYQIINGIKTYVGEYPIDFISLLKQMLTGKRPPKRPLRKKSEE